MQRSEFDDIRPFNAAEYPAAMDRIAANPLFPLLSTYVFPGRDVEEVRSMVEEIRDVEAFQRLVMHEVVQAVIDRSCTSFSWSGLDGLSRDVRYLFVSNHRDIMMDAAFQQYIFVNEGFRTAEITFGANLMSPGLVTDIGRANKMFRVERPGLSISSPKDFYQASVHLSSYIRHCIEEKGESVWIAQRNGRTKDGLDRTDQGIVKMFLMSAEDSPADALARLNVAPIAISYEWEPCDVLKVLECYQAARMSYEKKPGEDLNSIITGILQKKGRVHMAFCQPLSREDLEPFRGLPLNRFCKEVASLIDERIHAAYRLFPNNYIACDLRYGGKRYAEKYDSVQKTAFEEHLKSLEGFDTYDHAELRDRLLAIYSNPLCSSTR